MKRTVVPNEVATRQSTSEFVADTLRREILRGDYAPGQALLQDHIANRFGVSQSSVREALRRLEGLSLVDSFRNRGTFVSTLTPEQVEEIYDVRLAVELVSLRSNIAELTPQVLDDAERLLDSIENDREIAFLGELNKRFHAAFYGNSGKFVRDILQNVYGNLTRLWVDFVKKRPSLAYEYDQSSRREHRELLIAARNQDLSGAEILLTRHVCGARETLLAHLRDQVKKRRVSRTELLDPQSGEPSQSRRRRTAADVGPSGSDLGLRSSVTTAKQSNKKQRS